MKTLNERTLETITKGFANKRRILILSYLAKNPESDLTAIASAIKLDIKAVSEHVRKMTIAGLVMKRYQGRSVMHALTVRGTQVLTFLHNLTK